MNVALNPMRLQECRQKLGISKMEAAKRMQLSQPAYLRYEAGSRTPSLPTLTVIANTLGTSVEYLTDQSEDPQPHSYIISKSEEPEIFEIISLCRDTDRQTMQRIMAYANKLSKEDVQS